MKNQNSKSIINLKSVYKTYGTKEQEYPILKDINLEIQKENLTTIVGKSGSGKTTLLNMITGIDRPTYGEIIINGLSVQNLKEGQMANWRGRTIGIIFQFFQLMPTLTVIENVMLPMDLCNIIPPRLRKKRALALLEQMNIAKHANKLPTLLSGGEQQRVAIARSLANDPPIIIADEPTGNLDEKTTGIIVKLFEKLAEDGKTVVVVTHEQHFSDKVNQVITISDGKVVNNIQVNSLAEVL